MGECLVFSGGGGGGEIDSWWLVLFARAVWSAVIPLGWFAKHVQESRYTTSWIERACKEWYSQDNASPVWKTNLQPCPCTVHQAQADFGQFQVGCRHCKRTNEENPIVVCCFINGRI